MARRPQPSKYEVAYYEGLCRKTASMYVGYVEDDYDDIVQTLRVKAWRALQSYDPSRSKLPVERYVFSCMRNQVKDILKRKRRNDTYIEDFADAARDRFEDEYLSTPHDVTFHLVEDEPPLIPSTLTAVEREVVLLLYAGYSRREMALKLSIKLGQVDVTVQAIQAKMSDWRPTAVTSVAERVAA